MLVKHVHTRGSLTGATEMVTHVTLSVAHADAADHLLCASTIGFMFPLMMYPSVGCSP